MFAGKVDYASCEADWALPGASVGREEALADALALKRVAPDAAGNMWQAICGSRVLRIVEFAATIAAYHGCLRTILQPMVLKHVATRGHAVWGCHRGGSRPRAGRDQTVERPGRGR